MLLYHNYSSASFTVAGTGSGGGEERVALDESVYEAERLRLDTLARQSMAEASATEMMEADGGEAEDPKA
ncbi:unnamed protein product [Linum tenue]|uniref:Uncharacterized protein n=1 Tax=Linum tenue TaxID=586396 RepID=A0AAV0I2S8_9ROSI|nr:unnamed protein product [Linum tenue]